MHNPFRNLYVRKPGCYVRLKIFRSYLYITAPGVKLRQRGGGNYRRRKESGWSAAFNRRLKRNRGNNCTCAVCGTALAPPDAEIHHIIPFRAAPALLLDETNILILCHSCHVDLHRREKEQMKVQRSLYEEERGRLRPNLTMI